MAGSLFWMLAPALADTPPDLQPVPPPPRAAGPAPDLPAEFLGLFSDLCLNKFPDDDAVTALAEEKHATAMTADQVKRYLHNDPGAGWRLTGDGADYVVLIERPPYHACSVRHLVPVLYSPKTFFDAVKTYIAAKGHSLAPAVPQRIRSAAGRKRSARPIRNWMRTPSRRARPSW